MIHRLLLLSLTVGLFALVWSNDRPYGRRGGTEARLAARLVPAEVGVADHRSVVARADRAVAAPVPVVVRELTSGRVLILGGRIPSPRGLTEGVYQIVSSRGEDYRVVVPRGALRGALSPAAAADAHVESCGNVRWYFIRIEDEIQAAEAGRDERSTARQPDAARALMLAAKGLVRIRAMLATRMRPVVEGVVELGRRTLFSFRAQVAAWRQIGARWGERMGESLESSLRRIERSRRTAAAGAIERR